MISNIQTKQVSNITDHKSILIQAGSFEFR